MTCPVMESRIRSTGRDSLYFAALPHSQTPELRNIAGNDRRWRFLVTLWRTPWPVWKKRLAEPSDRLGGQFSRDLGISSMPAKSYADPFPRRAGRVSTG